MYEKDNLVSLYTNCAYSHQYYTDYCIVFLDAISIPLFQT